MKKIIICTLCIIFLTTSLLGCNSSSNKTNPSENEESHEQTTLATNSKSQLEYECGKLAYDNLVASIDLCHMLSDSIYNAWIFAIYEADDYGP